MPKSYSEQERKYIETRLKEEGAKCLAQYGIRHTTVDEIVRRANIPKGTFYLFYKSKELLLFNIILEYHDLIESELAHAVSNIDPDKCTAEELTKIIFDFYKTSSENPILKVLNTNEIELLARKLPPEVLAEHLNQDNSMIEKIFSTLKVKKNIDIASFSSAFRAIYFATLHKEEIGEATYDSAIHHLILGLVAQLM